MNSMPTKRAIYVFSLAPVAGRDLELLWLGWPVLIGLVLWNSALLPLQLLRLALGVIYLLWAPGYCLVAALFPAHDDLDGPDRAGLAIGLSVASLALLALFLEALPWGLQLWPILLGALGVCAVGTLIAMLRRVFGAQAAVAVGGEGKPWYRRRWLLAILGLWVCAGLLVGVVYLRAGAEPERTAFYLRGPDGLAEGFPRSATVGAALSVTFGVSNSSVGAQSYRAEVWVVDAASNQRALVATVETLVLEAGQTIEQQVRWSMPWVGDDQQVELLLFPQGDTTPIRRLLLWLTVTE